MNITSFKVAADKSSLVLDLDDAGTAINLYLWTKETYKVDEFKIDLSDKLNGQYSQIINITPEDIGVSKFDGVYFMDVVSTTETKCAIAAELTRYKECILTKVLANESINSCTVIEDVPTMQAQILLHEVEDAVELGAKQETLILIFALDKFCDSDCNTCGTYKLI